MNRSPVLKSTCCCPPAVRIGLLFTVMLLMFPSAGQSAEPKAPVWMIGFGKTDVTPTERVRLSGYGSREKVYESIADRLSCRAMALSKSQTESETMVLVSVDSIAVTAEMTSKISKSVEQKYGIPRSQLVICATHSHTAPHVAAGLTNLFRAALTDEESLAILRNTDRMIEKIIEAIDLAVKDRKSGTLELGGDQASFAVNRRVLKTGVWSGFGIQTDGPVDHRVRVLKATDETGKLRGAVFMYACHCTTLGPDFNQVSGDWAGLAATDLEKENPGAVFLATIGCGADANPNPRTSYDDSKAHASEMVAAVKRAIASKLTPLTGFPVGHFGYAGLAPELPTRDYLKAMSADANVYNRRWADAMTKIWNDMGRLPETYPAPIHTWQFGEELTWVFLGGEVVVDYQLKLEKLLPGKNIWVAAYTDDVFAYVASERMRAEGGYEVDFSMIYYMQPGRWATGTEDLLLRRAREVLDDNQSEDKPRNAQASHNSIRVPSEFTVDMMASEPTLADPINMAFGHDGRVWVVEMADYPLGNSSGGRVKWLLDSNGDGTLDKSQVFLDGLSYPTSVAPWRDGVLVVAAPDIIFARDTDSDGKADTKETLLVGIEEANPQHRASGFEMGLDGWLHLSAGHGTKQLESKRANKTFQVANRDLAWNPDSGEILTTTGETQFCRARDEFDRWYGNSNSHPIYQYVVDDKYVRQHSMGGASLRHLLDPPVAPPVYPASRTVDRFNDLYALNRFTSACSSIICRVPGLGESMRGAALVCEPVHNLIARFHVISDGASMVGQRFAEDEKLDWFASTDPWTRPVRALNSPDGTIWIVDMVRRVIEHPEWIPTAWQQRFDVRSGQNLGRMYRVRSRDYAPATLPNVAAMNGPQLLESLASNNGALRDLAQFQILWRTEEQRRPLRPALQELLRSSKDPAVRLQALATLVSTGLADKEDLATAISDTDPRVVRFAIGASEQFIQKHPELLGAIASRVDGNLGAEADLQILLTLGAFGAETTGQSVAKIIARHIHDPWVVRVLPLVNDGQLTATIDSLLAAIDSADEFSTTEWSEIEASLNRLLKRASAESQRQLIHRYFAANSSAAASALSWGQLLVLGGLAGSIKSDDQNAKSGVIDPKLIAPILDSARQTLLNSGSDLKLRSRLINLLGHGLGSIENELSTLGMLLAPNQPPDIQENALAAIRRMDDPKAADLLLASWSSMTADARRTASATLLQRRTWVEKLFAALENNSIKVGDLDAATIQQLRSSGDRSMMARCEQILGKPTNTDRNRLVLDYLGRFKSTPDRVSGELLYKEHCAACHLATPTKPIVGPPLENLKHWTTEQWVAAVLDPNRTIEPKFHQYSVLSLSGQVLAGVIERRTSTSIQLAISDGSRKEIPLSEIESLKDTGVSLMPEGIESKLSPDQLSDLLDFVRTKD